MKTCERVVLAALAVLALAMPAMAITIDNAQELDAIAVPLEAGNPFACGPDVYNNTTVGSGFTSGTLPRWHVLDDGAFNAGTAPVPVECVKFGLTNSASSNVIVQILFYDTLTPAGPICNAAFLGGVQINLGTVPAGTFTVGPVNFSPAINFPDDSWAVEVLFLSSTAPATASTTAGILFQDGPPTVGSNDGSVYWRDANANGTFECPGEARSFTAPRFARFYLQLQRTLPTSTEPTSWGNIKSLYR